MPDALEKDPRPVWDRLQDVFPEREVEWRVQSSGLGSEKPWALVVCYIQGRAVQRRLDAVVGVPNWKAAYREVSGGKGGMICALSVRDGSDGEWVTKEDGASFTGVESVKGGISDALKRAASAGFGLGRYLYYLDSAFANIHTSRVAGGQRITIKPAQNREGTAWTGWWTPPALPEWAIPADERAARKAAREAAQNTSGDAYGDEPPL